jgi:hypothetical protein
VSKITKVSRFALFLFVAAFATTAISGEAPSLQVRYRSRAGRLLSASALPGAMEN